MMRLGFALLALSLLVRVPDSPAEAPQPIDVKVKREVIGQVLAILERQYVFPTIAARMAEHVGQRQKAGAYDAVQGAEAFASALTEDLQAVSNDKHLRVAVRGGAGGNAADGGRRAPTFSADILDGNIGYLRLDGFPPASRLAAVLDPLMKDLVRVEALIVDLRDNRGGSPDGVAYLAGYLLPAKTLLARIYSRPDDATTELRALEVGGERNLNRPVYILTSKTTFSAAEAAAYHLKHLGRAKTVGEPSGGGAHRVQLANLGHGFAMNVPFTRPINAVTGGDWEGTGVLPDLAAPAADALSAAHVAALETLPATPSRAAALARIRPR